MAPAKLAHKTVFGNTMDNVNGVSGTRNLRSSISNPKIAKDNKLAGKRKAGSPLKEGLTKRAAFGDITNAIAKTYNNIDKDNIPVKKVVIEAKTLPSLKVLKAKYQENLPPIVSKVTKTQRVVTKVVKEKAQKPAALAAKKSSGLPVPATKDKSQEPLKNGLKAGKSAGSWRLSDEFSEASLYVSALDDINDSKVVNTTAYKSVKEIQPQVKVTLTPLYPTVPEGVSNFDKDNWNDPFQISNYATDIFNYLKSRESYFCIDDYMPRQKNLTSWMRSLLVDWMVEVQESFDMNHETLYLAVKLVDKYLCKQATKKEELQLLGAASLFIAAKFDERIIPLVDDFLYICDGAYTLRQFLGMEINVLKVIGFDLGIPLSYRFLRRYARCTRIAMPVLTLARYILELCLMEYAMVSFSDSKMAAAALFLAIKMKKLGTWTATHLHYTGYTLEEILPVAKVQNLCLHKTPSEDLSTVRNKYSHKIFFAVAKTPLITEDVLKA